MGNNGLDELSCSSVDCSRKAYVWSFRKMNVRYCALHFRELCRLSGKQAFDWCGGPMTKRERGSAARFYYASKRGFHGF